MDKLLYRLVKKHVSGTTMNSALKRAKELNRKDSHASITFLSNATDSKSKARYIASTYQELARQIARLGIKASIQVPSAQLCINRESNEPGENLRDVISTANKYGVFVWIEIPDGNAEYLNAVSGMRGCGVAIPASDMSTCLKGCKNVKAVKIIFNEAESSAKVRDRDIASLRILSKRISNIVLLAPPESLVSKSLSDSDMRKSIIFEFRLGQKSRSIKRIAKRKARLSTYLPFGKDWHAYAMNNVPEGYVRFITGKLLGTEGGDADA